MNQIAFWLEWAGGKLLAHPMRMIRPASYRSYWPDYQTEIHEPQSRVVIKPPGVDEVALMDEILLIPNLCVELRTRKVLHARSLVNPMNGRLIFGWTRLAESLHSDRRQVKRWWEAGIREVDERLDSIQRSRYSALLPLPSDPA